MRRLVAKGETNAAASGTSLHPPSCGRDVGQSPALPAVVGRTGAAEAGGNGLTVPFHLHVCDI